MGKVEHPAGSNPDFEALLTGFALGSARLEPEHLAWLGGLGKRLERWEHGVGLSEWGITALGYGSQSGSKQLNMALSIERAREALEHYESLVFRPHSMRGRAIGFGKDFPLDPLVKENPRDRSVHFTAGPRRVLLPAEPPPPKRVDVDLAEIAKAGMLRTRKVEIQITRSSETSYGVSKFLTGASYGVFNMNLTVRDSKNPFKPRHYTFTGSGPSMGFSLNPLPIDGSRSNGPGKRFEISLHETLEIDQFFIGKATVDVMAGSTTFGYRGRTGYGAKTIPLAMPPTSSVPGFSLLKRFNGRVRAGTTW